MKQPGYYEKRDRAIEQDERVKKAIAKDAAPRGAKTYIKKRQADLKKVRGY
jgi:hypothetical protein